MQLIPATKLYLRVEIGFEIGREGSSMGDLQVVPSDSVSLNQFLEHLTSRIDTNGINDSDDIKDYSDLRNRTHINCVLL